MALEVIEMITGQTWQCRFCYRSAEKNLIKEVFMTFILCALIKGRKLVIFFFENLKK